MNDRDQDPPVDDLLFDRIVDGGMTPGNCELRSGPSSVSPTDGSAARPRFLRRSLARVVPCSGANPKKTKRDHRSFASISAGTSAARVTAGFATPQRRGSSRRRSQSAGSLMELGPLRPLKNRSPSVRSRTSLSR